MVSAQLFWDKVGQEEVVGTVQFLGSLAERRPAQIEASGHAEWSVLMRSLNTQLYKRPATRSKTSEI